MRAVVIGRLDGPDAARVMEVPRPEGAHFWADGQRLLLEVHAAGVSFPDLLMTRGLYQHVVPAPYICGGEVGGVVLEAPAGCGLAPGDRVASLVRYGAIAEFALAAPAYTIRLPDSMSFAEGAALYANYTTAWFALYRARVQHGEWVLVRGAAGGVGTAALQIIKAAEARSIALVSSDAKRRAAAAMGADEVLVTSEPWRAEIGALTGGTGVAVVLDPVGGDGLRDCLMTMAVAGRAVIIGFASGAISVIDVGLLKDRNLTMIGISMDIYEQRHAGTISDVNRAVQALAERAAVKPVISRRLPLEGGADALKMLERRDAIGKIVVDVRP